MASKIIFMIACVIVGAAYGRPENAGADVEVAYSEEIPHNYPYEVFEDHVRERSLKLLNKYDGQLQEETIDDKYNCVVRTKPVRPYTVRDGNMQKYVVQANSFQQWIKQTDCVNKDAECFNHIMKPKSLKATCKPTYSTIKLYLYDPELKEYQHGSFEFPACCSCSLKNF